LNLLGFTCYSLYNCVFYWSSAVAREFHAQYPRSQLPVQPNDIAFAVHAVCVTLFTIGQCVIYERGEQRVSLLCRALIAVLLVFGCVCTILAFVHSIDYYELITFISYIKLAVTLTKYIPQAFMNYRRRSTVGWSIGNVLLDMTGGSMSIAQMMLIAFNTNDWAGMFTDLTKFGLGAFSLMFDVLFVTQHYVLYRNRVTSPDDSRDDRAILRTEAENPSSSPTREGYEPMDSPS